MDATYKKLIEKFPLLPIETEEHYERALAVLSELGQRDGHMTPGEIGYGKALVTLIQKFDTELCKKLGHVEEKSSGEELLEFLMEQHKMTQVRAAEIAGVSKQKINDFLHGRCDLPRGARAKLGEFFRLSPHIFAIVLKKTAV